MGGRGKSSETVKGQVRMEVLQDRAEVEQIIENSEAKRDQLAKTGELLIGGHGKADLRSYKRCACCREFTVPIHTINHQCEICGWIDDRFQNTHIDSPIGPNTMTLVEAKRKMKKS